ncbi:hypothetical protein J3459_015943 [Metarhizium acridum]|nr:hypothetical protein J3459_015943 [Metarhizium acridum]
MLRFLPGPRKSPSPSLSTDLESSLEVDEVGHVPIWASNGSRDAPKRFFDDFKRNESDRFFPEHHLSPANSRTASHPT